MPSGINHVVLLGNLTRDPELRTIPSGTSVCELGLAVNERFKNPQSGQWEDRANYFDITVWGAQGESCAKYLSKGRPIAVDGRLRWESWEKDGQKRSKVKVVANTVQFLGSPSDGGGKPQESYKEYEPDVPIEPVVQPSAPPPDDLDDIPFMWDGVTFDRDDARGYAHR